MAEKTPETRDFKVMEIFELDSDGGTSVAVEEQTSTWQMVLRYRGAIIWSAFIGLAGINWGMDVLVRLSLEYNCSI